VAPNSVTAFRFDRIYFCSQSVKAEAERAGFRVSHGEVIYPSIPMQLYVGDLRPRSVALEKFLVVARLNRASGVLTAVKALRAARDRKCHATLTICGRGDSDYIAEVRSYVAMHQLPVEFLSLSNIQRDLPGIYRRHDALLYTAEWREPFATIPLEAMAAGLPVIGADIGGAQELFRHGENCLVFIPGNVEELAGRLQQLQDDPDLRCRLAETAQQEVLTRFNETVGTDRIEAYLQSSCEIWQQEAS
jgi:glycosyltransferase involved in cell wall biosynthesis